jgi:Family of unknown function (DUF6308)
VTFRLPAALQSDDDRDAIKALKRYYGPSPGQPRFYTGSLFDAWDSTGTRADDTNRFTADDLVAVTFLSVEVPPKAAYALLIDRADEFSELLGTVGPDRDLADEADPVVDDDWPGWQLTTALRTLPKVGPTKASKLIARKRPRLRPVYDSVVAAVTSTAKHQWEPMRLALRQDDQALQHRLVRLREEAGLPQDISTLRVLDVIAWLEGKDRGL